VPEEYGGPGGDFLHSTIVNEEMARVGASGPAFSLHSDIIVPYLQAYGSEDQTREWLPKVVSGETVMAIGMTEPAAGSDLQGIKTRADRDGNHFVINGQKVFISNGQIADLYILACKTDPSEGAKGISLILVEGDRDGFQRGRNMEKIGAKAQDTSELFFEDVRVPITNLLGQEGRGFAQLMQQLSQERLVVAIRCATAIEAALEETVRYTSERQAFGRRLADFQNTRFKLAEVKTQALVTRVFIDRCIELHVDGALGAEDAAAAKLHTTEVLNKVVDECLQLHGGYGYMWEFPIARAWADARMSRIAGGSSEIMKEIISRDLLAGTK
jgi:acyl-CoA dehydrogenase